jgi:hypothetical protein
VNPYEKFTQPQFDTWIGDITGALRDALGFQAELPPKPKARTHWHIPPSEGSEAPVASEEDEDADAEMDDSFADVQARRATSANAKGKGRDPREGPGLGKGDRGAPIEIDLDSEEEQEEEEEEEWEEEEEGFRTSDEEEEEEAIRNGESSARAHARYKKYAEQYEEEAEDEEEYGDEEQEINPEAIEVISDDEDTNELQPEDGEVSGEEYSDGENANPTSLLIGHGHAVERDYSDQGEETGSESENEAGKRVT